jgi:hypothetical protein
VKLVCLFFFLFLRKARKDGLHPLCPAVKKFTEEMVKRNDTFSLWIEENFTFCQNRILALSKEKVTCV